MQAMATSVANTQREPLGWTRVARGNAFPSFLCGRKQTERINNQTLANEVGEASLTQRHKNIPQSCCMSYLHRILCPPLLLVTPSSPPSTSSLLSLDELSLLTSLTSSFLSVGLRNVRRSLKHIKSELGGRKATSPAIIKGPRWGSERSRDTPGCTWLKVLHCSTFIQEPKP